MGDVTPVDWLRQEVQNLLAMGPVGLYEFIWGLNGTSYGLTQAEALDLSRLVAREIVQAGRARLFAVRWPDMQTVDGPLSTGVLDEPASWSEGESGPLIALVPADDVEASGAPTSREG